MRYRSVPTILSWYACQSGSRKGCAIHALVCRNHAQGAICYNWVQGNAWFSSIVFRVVALDLGVVAFNVVSESQSQFLLVVRLSSSECNTWRDG